MADWTQKPRPWEPGEDPSHCIACSEPFGRRDQVFRDVAVAYHHDCLDLYIKQCKDLGIIPPEHQKASNP